LINTLNILSRGYPDYNQRKKILKGALIVHKSNNMRRMNYQASDATEKLSKYQTKTSQDLRYLKDISIKHRD